MTINNDPWTRFFTYDNKVKKTTNRREYLRNYHNTYRQEGLNKDYYEALTLLNSVLRKGYHTSPNLHLLANICCCELPFLVSHLGLDNEYVMNAFRGGEYEIDHLIPKKWFKTHPKYVHYMNHWSNLVISRKTDNRSKGSKVDMTNPKVVMLMITMKKESMNAEIASHFPHPVKRAEFLNKLQEATNGSL